MYNILHSNINSFITDNFTPIAFKFYALKKITNLFNFLV